MPIKIESFCISLAAEAPLITFCMVDEATERPD